MENRKAGNPVIASLSRGGAVNPSQEKGFETKPSRCATHVAQFANKRRSAFTLAEVLITLGIIGVVAALTLPTLIQNYEKKQTVVKLQKSFSLMQQAVKLAEVDNGEPSGWSLPDVSHPGNTRYFAETLFFPYLKTVYTSIPATNKCWTDTKTMAGKSAQNLGLSEFGFASACANLSNGSSIYLWAYAPGDPRHAQIYVDINGYQKGPNVFGKDVFNFYYEFSTGKFFANGHQLSRETLLSEENAHGCSRNNPSRTVGYYCTALIMVDGWEIKDDYPW